MTTKASKKKPAAVATEKLSHKLAVERGKLGGRKPAPDNETKAERFNRLATERVNKVLAALPGLGKLARRDVYEPTSEAIDKIEAVLLEAVQREIALLRTQGRAGFSL